jgi:hypothetical protein
MAKTNPRHRAKVDPIVALVTTADRALETYVKAANAISKAREKLSVRDRFGPSVTPPQHLNYLPSIPWRADFLFTSEDHIDDQFKRVTKRLKDEISEMRRGRKKPLTSDVESRISRNQMMLAMLPKLHGPLKREFRAEAKRVLAVQRRVGLIELRKRERDAWAALYRVTEQISKAKPATAAGALALVGYVGWRSWPEYQDFFSENGKLPAHFAQVLRAAHQRLQQSIAA